jgi:hypothetical protein
MKYALLVYDLHSSWHDASREQRHVLHEQYHDVASSSGVIAHYRVRAPQKTATIQVEDDRVVKTEGPLADTRETFRALYLIEEDDPDAVVELAARIPAARKGGAVEVWLLLER